MINKELVKSYVNQLSIEQLRKIVFEVINHYQLMQAKRAFLIAYQKSLEKLQN